MKRRIDFMDIILSWAVLMVVVFFTILAVASTQKVGTSLGWW